LTKYLSTPYPEQNKPPLRVNFSSIQSILQPTTIVKIMKTEQSKHTNSSSKSSAEEGASLVEYALLVALIAVVTLMGVKSVGESVWWTFQDAEQAIAQCGVLPC